MCLQSEVDYLPIEESIARQTGWMRVAVAKSLVMYLLAMESCKAYIRFVRNRRMMGKAGTEGRCERQEQKAGTSNMEIYHLTQEDDPQV